MSAFTQKITFTDLTKLLEAVSTTKSVKKRDEYMRAYFVTLHRFRNEYKSQNKDSDCSLLPVMRMILAQEEKERTYGLQEKTLRQLYIKALKLHKDSSDAVKISQCCEEDLPNTISEVMKSRTSSTGTLSIHEVDMSLNYLCDNQKQVLQENELKRIILRSNAVDQKWFCKIILKRMNLQLGITKILKFYHPKGHELFLKYNHLTKVVELIESGQAESAMLEITKIFEPIRSMLCQKFTPSLNKDFLQKEMYQETKMDGERFQLHMKDRVFRYYSRNGHEFSNGFNLLLTPLIEFSTVVHSIILDGEMLVYDKDANRYHTKGETSVDVKYMKDVNSNLRPCFCAFDILLYNDQNMMNQPYSQRSQLLGQLFKDREGVLVKSVCTKIRDVDHMIDLFNIAIENEEEGIVLKDAASVYKPGDRAGGWYKVKPDYFDGAVVKEFDCVIIGGYYENYHTRNFIQRYMVGAVEKLEDGTFKVYAVGEVVHGVTVQERMRINESLKPHLVEHSREAEVSFGFGKIYFGKNKPHVWVPPQHSIVLEIRVSELAKTYEQFTDYTFRFPRISNVRRDKIWDDSCTLKEFLEMTTCDGSNRVKKVVMRNVKKSDIAAVNRKRKGSSSNFEQTLEDEEEEVIAIDNALEGKEFCVLNAPLDDKSERQSTDSLKRMVKQHGGTITALPRSGKTFGIIFARKTKMIQTYIDRKVFNVIKADWLVRHFAEEKVYKEMPKIRPIIDLIYATDDMKDSLKELYDKYGDSYTEGFQTNDQLKEFVETMEMNRSDDNLVNLDKEMSQQGFKNLNFFRGLTAAFPQIQMNPMIQASKSSFRFRGGTVVELDEVDAKCLVIFDKNEDVEQIKNLFKNSIPENNIVDYRWIIDSTTGCELLSKDFYLLTTVSSSKM